MLKRINHNFIRSLNNIANRVFKPKMDTIATLTYVDTITYFVHNKPDDVRVTKGCVLIQDHTLGFLTTWTFLDSNNDLLLASKGVPYGRKLIVISFDDELKETLGDSKLLIVE